MTMRSTQSVDNTAGDALPAAAQDNGKAQRGEFALLNRVPAIGMAIAAAALLASAAGFTITGSAIWIIVGSCFVIAAMLTWIACGSIVMWQAVREMLTLRHLASNDSSSAKAER